MVANIDCFFNSRPFNAAWDSCTRKFSPDYHIYIRELFEEYSTHLEKDWSDVAFYSACGGKGGCTLADIIKPILPVVSKLSEDLNQATESFLRGHLSNAIRHFDKGMAEIKKHLDNIRVVHLVQSNNDIWTALQNISTDYGHSELYRVRKLSEEDKKSPTPEMLFHVPFHKRHMVSASRFSLTGVPCLYLSSSQITAAWEAIHSKDAKDYVENVYYAEFNWNTDNTPKLIELQVTPMSLRKLCSTMTKNNSPSEQDVTIKQYVQIFMQYVQSYLACWPLQLACSIPVKYRGNEVKFNEEYIIPQLLMHWLQQQPYQGGFHGICYRTTRLHPAIEKVTPPKYILNYALPTKSIKDKGHCDKLLSFFSKPTLPKPISDLCGAELFEALKTYSS